jgi:chitin-binding protein
MLSVKSLKIITMATMLWGVGDRAFAHGLLQSPASRNWFCGAITKPDEVANGVAQFPVCGGAFAFNQTAGYNFMSVLTHTLGRAVLGPRTNVCGFNSESFGGGATVWDQPIDWPTTNITAGPQTFTWNITWGPHFSDTQEFRYWITKPGFQFQVGRPLSFSDFEDEPFCTLTYNDANPTANPAVIPDKANAQFQNRCTVPERTGRHVIYTEWGRNQFTFERFHGCADVQFRAGPVIDARIARTPNAAEFIGSGTIRLDGTTSLGTGLTYHWDVTGPDPSLYMLANPDQPVATLTLATPLAAANVTISLVVTSSTGSDSATVTLVHRPSAASPWFDMGVLTQAARALTAGNRVSIRAVQSTGQDLFFPSSPLAITAANASATEWPFELAQAVNALNGNVRIGLLNAQGQVVPTRDAIANRIYTVSTAGITGVFLQVVAAAPSCRVNYQIVSQWGNGFQANVSVVNTSTTIPIFGYTLTWSLGIGETFGSGWNATYTPAGTGLAASNTAGHWNGVMLQNGGTVSFGFLANKGSGNVGAPTDFRLNGEPCTTTQTASLPMASGTSSLARAFLPAWVAAPSTPAVRPSGLTSFLAPDHRR